MRDIVGTERKLVESIKGETKIAGDGAASLISAEGESGAARFEWKGMLRRRKLAIWPLKGLPETLRSPVEEAGTSRS